MRRRRTQAFCNCMTVSLLAVGSSGRCGSEDVSHATDADYAACAVHMLYIGNTAVIPLTMLLATHDRSERRSVCQVSGTH